eukprot:227614_1
MAKKTVIGFITLAICSLVVYQFQLAATKSGKPIQMKELKEKFGNVDAFYKTAKAMAEIAGVFAKTGGNFVDLFEEVVPEKDTPKDEPVAAGEDE